LVPRLLLEPKYIRSDNGPEFIAYTIEDWLKERHIKSLYIKPGCPWENGYIESFHDKLRDEFLNREIFGSLLEAKVLPEHWRLEYNQKRPHSSLENQTPDEFAATKEHLKDRTISLICPTFGVRPDRDL